MRTTALAFVLATGLSFTTVRASAIAYNNFGAGDSYDQMNSYTVWDRVVRGQRDYQAIAMPFNSAVTDNVERYTVAVYGDKAFTLQLYQDNAGVPGAVLETLTTPVPASSSVPALMEVLSVGNPHLVAGNKYWVALVPVSTSTGAWMYTTQSVSGMASQIDPGGTWTPFYLQQSALRVEVPEPATVGVFALAILGILNQRLRKA